MRTRGISITMHLSDVQSRMNSQAFSLCISYFGIPKVALLSEIVCNGYVGRDILAGSRRLPQQDDVVLPALERFQTVSDELQYLADLGGVARLRVSGSELVADVPMAE
jgi:hypothetical protein